MNEVPISLLYTGLVILLLVSAFFSSSETGMLSLNRYRLKHREKEGHGSAKKVLKLLNKPDRLISIILIGNNLVNVAAAQIVTLIAAQQWPEHDIAVIAGGLLLTLALLIFSEVTPKTLAQMYPERIAFPASYVLSPLSIILFPFYWLISHVVSLIFWLLRINRSSEQNDALSHEELKTLVNESGHKLSEERQNMLLGILDLENVRVNDIMIPRPEVVGIDLDDDIETITQQIKSTKYTRLPVYKDDLNKVLGILHIRDAAEFLWADKPSKVMLTRKSSDPYFVPENTSLYNQLFNFQQEKINTGLVVDEYGDVQGMITLADILEEIVGEFTTDELGDTKEIHPQQDGSLVIDGTATIRDINKALDWTLPTDTAKTINGLILEKLEDIPDANVSLKIQDYTLEILQIKDNQVIAVRARTL